MSQDDHIPSSGHVVQMENPVTIRFRWTTDELSQAYRYHFRHVCRPAFRRALHGIFAAMLVGGVLGCLQETGVRLAIPLGLICGGIYWFAVRPFERRWAIRRQFARRPDKDDEIEWQIAPEGIRTNSTNTRSESRWEAFSKVVLTARGFIFYRNDQILHWLPRHAFAGDAEFGKVAELVKAKVREVYDVA
jgi:hypothetical protein